MQPFIVTAELRMQLRINLSHRYPEHLLWAIEDIQAQLPLITES